MTIPNVKWEIQQLVDWQRQPTPDTRWLLEGLLPAGSIAWISGPRKTGFKSWMAFLMSMSVASGMVYGDHFVPLDPERIWFIEEEGTTIDTKSRQRKIQLGCFGWDFWQEDPFGGNYFWSHHRRLKLDNPLHVRQIIQTANENKIKLIILDAITYMHDGDENSTQDMRRVADAVMDIRAKTGATILGIRHTSKQSQREDEDIDLGSRGSSVLDDVYDAHFALRRDKKTGNLWMKVRYRDHAEQFFNVWWQIQKCAEEPHRPHRNKKCKAGTCGHACALLQCTHMASLTMGHRGEEDGDHELFNKLIRGKVPPNKEHSFDLFYQLVGGTRAQAAKLRTRWLELELIEEPEGKKKGFIVPSARGG